jgi:hypothetical protein
VAVSLKSVTEWLPLLEYAAAAVVLVLVVTGDDDADADAAGDCGCTRSIELALFRGRRTIRSVVFTIGDVLAVTSDADDDSVPAARVRLLLVLLVATTVLDDDGSETSDSNESLECALCNEIDRTELDTDRLRLVGDVTHTRSRSREEPDVGLLASSRTDCATVATGATGGGGDSSNASNGSRSGSTCSNRSCWLSALSRGFAACWIACWRFKRCGDSSVQSRSVYSTSISIDDGSSADGNSGGDPGDVARAGESGGESGLAADDADETVDDDESV